MKNEFRKKCIEERKQIPQAEKDKASEIVFNKLTSMDIYKKAESIFNMYGTSSCCWGCSVLCIS